MNFRMGMILAGSIVFVGGCAASSGGSAGPSTPAVRGESLAQGERPREDNMTRSAEDHLAQGEAAATPEEAAQHYTLAAQQAQAAVEADPTNPLGHRLLGEARLGLGDFAGANTALSEAERLRPVYILETEAIRENAWIGQYQQAGPLIEAGDYPAAIELFEQADAIYEERPEVKVYLGQLYVQEERYEEGIDVLREAIAIINSDRIEMMDSTTAASWRDQEAQLPVYITQALMRTERYDEAAVELEGLLATDPGNMGYLRQLAALYIQTDRPLASVRDSFNAVFIEGDAVGELMFYGRGAGGGPLPHLRARRGCPRHLPAHDPGRRSVVRRLVRHRRGVLSARRLRGSRQRLPDGDGAFQQEPGCARDVGALARGAIPRVRRRPPATRRRARGGQRGRRAVARAGSGQSLRLPDSGPDRQPHGG